MSENKVDLKKLAQQLVELSVLQVNELNQILKDEYNIEPAAAPVVAAPVSGDSQAAADSTDSKQQFDVVLKDAGAQKVAVIKALKDALELPLGEAKGLVDEAPSKIKEQVAKDEAEKIKTDLEAVGATIELS